MKIYTKFLMYITIVVFSVLANNCKKEIVPADIWEYDITIHPDEQYQTIEGFGASLAFYENWLIAHPNKKEIYDAIFSELSLDILRIRNAYDYDDEMIYRVTEFIREAEASAGTPVKIMSTSWGPPAYLKSNDDRMNGGTLKYSVTEDKVGFDYSGFASWWEGALNEYNNNQIYPDYLSIQNEPDFTASWESCRFDPVETINSTDTIAGYDKALEAVYKKIETRSSRPLLLGPESVGIGYNTVENYIDNLNTHYLYGIAHHLYHGADENNPWVSPDFAKVGQLHPGIPHFQTEYGRGDWFTLAGFIYKSLNDENVVAYLYWDLIWDKSGLIGLDFPWDETLWTNSKGYKISKEFYALKQFSAFIHPGWKRIGTTNNNDSVKALGFINPEKDCISLVLINRSDKNQYHITIEIDDYTFENTSLYTTSQDKNCVCMDPMGKYDLLLPSHSINTVVMIVKQNNDMR